MLVARFEKAQTFKKIVDVLTEVLEKATFFCK